MPEIVMLSSRSALWRDFLQDLEKTSGVQTGIVDTGAEIVQAAREQDLLAVILDKDIQVMPGAELVRRLISINAMIHVAWASELTDEAFHQATEGLGVLMKLSPQPDVDEARLLAERLCRMSGSI